MVGIWNVGDYFELDAGTSRSSIDIEKGEKISPVLVVVDSNCRQQLEMHADKLVQYSDGAAPKNFGVLTETSDSENPMTADQYETLMEKRSQSTFGRGRSSAAKGNKAVPSHVSITKCETSTCASTCTVPIQ
jgi:hypothetical protein